MDSTPIMQWDSEDAFDDEGRVVWWATLDNRYQVEVHRTDGQYNGRLCVFDHAHGDKVIHQSEVVLSYAARFGPDIADVAEWEKRVIEIIESEGDASI